MCGKSHYSKCFKNTSIINTKQIIRNYGGLTKIIMRIIIVTTLQGTNISPKNCILKMIFPFPKVGYLSSLEGI